MSMPAVPEVLVEAASAVRSAGRAALCQIVRAEGSTPGKVGWKLLVRTDGSNFGNLGGGAFEALVAADALAKLRAPAPRSELKRYYLTEEAVRGEATGMVCGGMAEVFLEVMVGAPLLVVFGGGPVGQAVAQAGALAGFDLVVVDDRPEMRRPELFPAGTELPPVDRELASDFLAPFRAPAERELYVAVVSRCWETDLAALTAVIRQLSTGGLDGAPTSVPNLRYLGLMGSARKIDRVRERLAAAGVGLDGFELRAPIGLPIGGDSPGEIAIGVLAEILAVRHGAASGAAPAPRATPATTAKAGR